MITQGFSTFIAKTKSKLRSDSSHQWIEEIVVTAFEASLRKDELRQISFRLALSDLASKSSLETVSSEMLPLIFSEPRAFNSHELRKLAPAVGFSRSLILVWPNKSGVLEITGILYTGSNWLQVVQGGRRPNASTPASLIVHVLAPGCLETRFGDTIVSQMKHGHVAHESLDIFESRWLPERFEHVRQELLEEFERNALDDMNVCVDAGLFGKLTQQMLKRTIAAVQGNHHGGTIIIAPQNSIRTVIDQGDMVLKETFRHSSITGRHRELMLKAATLLSSLAGNIYSRKVGWEEYTELSHQSLNELDEALFDEAYLIGGLAGADGAVVINERFELLGFGAEIFAHDSNITKVFRSLNVNGEKLKEESSSAFGTRHRSAFRLIHKYPDIIACVISQDGDVRFIANQNGNVIYFEHEAALVVELVL